MMTPESRRDTVLLCIAIALVAVVLFVAWFLTCPTARGNPVTSGTFTVALNASDARRGLVAFCGAGRPLGNGTAEPDTSGAYPDQGAVVRADSPRVFGGCSADTVWALPRPITVAEGWLTVYGYFAGRDTVVWTAQDTVGIGDRAPWIRPGATTIFQPGQQATVLFASGSVTWSCTWDTTLAAVGMPARLTSLSGIGADAFGAFWLWTVTLADSADPVLGPGRWYTLTFSRDPPPAGAPFLEPDPALGRYAEGSITPCPPGDTLCAQP